MKISVSNLGAIKKATIHLGGLTIFVGQNGTGKSYLAKVVYGLQRFETIFISCINNPEKFYEAIFNSSVGSTEELIRLLEKYTAADLRDAIPRLANLHGQLFASRLAEYFNDDSKTFKKTTITYTDIEELSTAKLEGVIDATLKQIKHSIAAQSNATLTSPEHFLWLLCVNIFVEYGGGFADYFPAARSNFMLTYKALYRARADEHVGLESISDKLLLASKGNHTRRTGALIRFDKPTEDFLSRLYDLDSNRTTSLMDVANKLEQFLYGEDQLLVDQSEGTLPDFRYHIKNTDNKIRLHLASSMVTETSPLLIGLRHWIEPNGVLIIDEPESHLHPEAQKALVNVLTSAVNKGLRVLLITHSPYILSCVNNLIKLKIIKDKYPQDSELESFIKANSQLVAIEKPVAAYLYDRKGKVKDMVSVTTGLIDEAEFTEPFDEISEVYEALRSIEWAHRK